MPTGDWNTPFAIVGVAILTMVATSAEEPVFAKDAQTVSIGGTGAALAGMNLLAASFTEQRPDAELSVEVLPSLGSSGGIKALLSGALDIAVVSRRLQPDEIAQGAVAEIYATTAVAFVTNPDNAVDEVTFQQVEDIYAGRMTHWPDGKAIRLVLRAESETDIKVLRSVSPALDLALNAAFERPGLLVPTNDQENATALERLPDSFGMATVAQLTSERRKLKMLLLDGVDPATLSGKRQAYPMMRDFFLVTMREPSKAALQFIDFSRSPAGRALLRQNGHQPSSDVP